MNNFKIKMGQLDNEDLKAIAEFHSKFIDLGFLSQLGEKVLFYLYKSLNECDGSILIIAKKEEDLVGFVSGSTGLGLVYKHLIRHHFIGITMALAPSIFSLTKLKRILEILFYSKQGGGVDVFPHSELLSLAVREDFRKIGVAKKLCQELIMQFGKDGVDGIKIIVGEELIGAQRFYEKMGAVKVGLTEVHKGSRSFVYRLEV